MRRFISWMLLGAALSACTACASSSGIFPSLSDQLATPISMAVDVANNRLYVVNSNAKVLYDWTQGSVQALDITTPTAPVLLNTTPTASFSGQIYLDLATHRAFIPNRYSPSDQVDDSALFNFNVDTGSAEYMSYASQPMGENAYAIACCYPPNRAWVTTSEGVLQYFDVTDPASVGEVVITTTLDNGGTITHAEVNHIAMLGNMAYLSREYGGILVANMDDAGVPGSVPVDYYLNDIPNPTGIATDGRYVYVVNEGDRDGDYHRSVTVIDPTFLTPLVGNTSTVNVTTWNSSLVVAYIEVGKTPEEIQLSSQYAFVTNQEDDTLSVIDLPSLTVIATIAVGDQPFSMVLYTTPGGVDQYLYIGNIEGDTITILDIPTLTVVGTYPIAG